MKTALLILVVVITVLVGSIAIAGFRWDSATKTMLAELTTAASAHSTSQPVVTELTQLPAPVQRYFRMVLGRDPAAMRITRMIAMP